MYFVWRNIGRINIRIHRDIEGPPNNPSGKLAKKIACPASPF
jgi:hypothetical protein